MNSLHTLQSVYNIVSVLIIGALAFLWSTERVYNIFVKALLFAAMILGIVVLLKS